MPLYDYQCDDCAHAYEARHSMTADAPPCPNCGSENVGRRITTAPTVARGILAPAGTSKFQSKEALRDKWAEETPKLRKKLEDKLGTDTVRKNAPTLYND